MQREKWQVARCTVERLRAPLGYRPPAEVERAFYADQSRLDITA
ncbi:hypothetical protein [Komagataeibacter xylinus]